jgi:hypothetical protein
MSEYTAEATEFEGGACRACGADAYAMLADGPRCCGCKRFVVKDTHAGTATPGVERLLTRDARQDAIRMEQRAIALARELEAWLFDDEEPAPKPKPKPKRTRRRTLKVDEVLAEVDAILKEGKA